MKTLYFVDVVVVVVLCKKGKGKVGCRYAFVRTIVKNRGIVNSKAMWGCRSSVYYLHHLV
jgi:hypothetical protein